jgi:hypothetical protein
MSTVLTDLGLLLIALAAAFMLATAGMALVRELKKDNNKESK